MEQPRDLSLSTLAVAAGRPPRTPGEPLAPPIVPASTFHAGTAIAYGRDGNPTWAALEQTLGALEGGTAVTFSSGMAALDAILHTVPVGGAVVAPAVAYSGSVSLLDQLEQEGRIQVRRAPAGDTEAYVAATSGADLVLAEAAANPTLEVTDVPALAAAARAAGARLVIDATFVTPVVHRALDHGADLVLHSATKFLGGHSDVLLGAVVGRDESWTDQLRSVRHDRGGIPGAFEAWLVLRGIRTLAVRMERSQATAAALAARLGEHPAVSTVRHPSLPGCVGHEVAARDWTGFGPMLALEVHGDADRAERVASATTLWTHATSLGGVESTLERRRRWPAEPSGVPETLLRLSVGIEDLEDLWTDLDHALTTTS